MHIQLICGTLLMGDGFRTTVNLHEMQAHTHTLKEYAEFDKDTQQASVHTHQAVRQELEEKTSRA